MRRHLLRGFGLGVRRLAMGDPGRLHFLLGGFGLRLGRIGGGGGLAPAGEDQPRLGDADAVG